MPEILRMNQAELEALVENKLRAAHDAQSGSGVTAPANTRGREDGDEPVGGEHAAPQRSMRNPNSTRQSKLTRKEAEGIMTFFRAFVQGDRQGVEKAFTQLGERTSLQQVGVSADGGTTLPSLFSTEVLIDLPAVTPFADPGIVRIIPMENETLRWTKVTARPSQPPAVKEGASYTKTGVSFAPILLVAKKIGEIIPFTEEILQSNAIGMVQVISQLVAEAFAFKYNALVTNGLNNADEPEGVTVNTSVVSTPCVTTDDRTKADSFIDTFHSMPSQYRNTGPIWMMADGDIAKVRKLKDLEGRYIWQSGLSQGRPDTLLGRPVFENPDLTAGTVLFGNFLRGYVIGRREGMTIQVNSSGTDWEKDITNYKFRERWDGRVHDAKAFVKMTGLT